MEIPINQFEQYIEETILARGLAYFRDGYVNDLEEIAPGIYEALVAGTEDYLVRLTIKNGVVTEHACSCPYDYGPVCKHLTSVLFYLQQHELGIEQKKPKAQGEKKQRKKRKTKAEQVAELLEKMSHDELKQFIIEQTTQDRYFRDLLLSSFAYHNSSESKAQYRSQIKSILRTVSDEYGFVNWSASRQVNTKIFQLIDIAQKQSEKNNYKSAFFICTAIMEEMTEALQYSDDSNGDIGECIHYACEMVYNMTKHKLPKNIRTHIFDYCIDAYEKNTYSDWDWHTDMLYIASLVLTTDDEFNKLMQIIDNHNTYEYAKEVAQEIKYEMLLKIKGEDAANDYLESNINNPRLRKKAIAKAIDHQDYKKARSLSLDGIRHDEKDKPGLAKEWYDWLLKIAQATNDEEKIIEYARYLFIDNFMNEQDYYQILKQHVPPEKWNNYVFGIIQDIKAQSRWLDTGFISSIYIREEWWDQLFELLQQSPDLNSISHYEQYLSKDYSNELVEMYSIAIIEYLKHHVSRKHYKVVCRYLRRMIKLGGREKANELIEQFRKDYPARKALMEELDYV